MKTFKEFILADTHQHATFDAIYACYMAYLGRASRNGFESAKREKPSFEECRAVYKDVLAQGTASQAQGCATKIVRNAIDQHADDTINALEDNGSVRPVTQSAASTRSINTTTTSTTIDTTSKVTSTQASEVGSKEPKGCQNQSILLNQGENDEDCQAELAMVASCTPFAHLVMTLYRKCGHAPPHIDAPVLFPSVTANELYNFAESILNEWDTCSKVQQKNCLVALSGVVNTLDADQQQHITVFSDVAGRLLDKDLFNVSEAQAAIFTILKRKLGRRTIEGLRSLRRHCSRRVDELEEEYDGDGWKIEEEEVKQEELRIMQMMEFLCGEILGANGVTHPSEHEDVFLWRGLARIMHVHDVVVRVGELGSSATREDRTEIESGFGGTESNVRSRKIDIMHQLCLQGSSKPAEMVAWEVKSETASSEVLQAQLRKNIRINASIMNKQSHYMERSFPRPSPIILDITGSRALVYTVRKIEPGIFGAGAVGDKLIELPRNVEEIPRFLDGGNMSALLRVGLHNSKYSGLLKEGYQNTTNRSIMAKITGSSNIRKEGPPVIFTPTKKQKQKHKQQ